MKGNELITLSDNEIKNKIYTLRGLQMMLDSDLAELYNVETKTLNQAVKRNIERFPINFMFQISKNEFENLRSQIVTTFMKNKASQNMMPSTEKVGFKI